MIKIPKAYKDAMNSPEGKDWKGAMNYKLTKLEEINTWSKMDETDVPQGAQILQGMWVHLVKNLELGEQKLKSQWVLQGDKQKTNLSLSNTFVPVSQITSLKFLLALATIKDLRIFTWMWSPLTSRENLITTYMSIFLMVTGDLGRWENL